MAKSVSRADRAPVIKTAADIAARCDFRGECLIWTRRSANGGTGWHQAFVRHLDRNKNVYRLMYELTTGPIGLDYTISPGAVCGEEKCINPRHMVVTPHKSITRYVRVGYKPKAILTQEKVLEVIDLLDAGVPYRQIAVRYGISVPTVAGINSGKLWAKLTGRVYRPKRRWRQGRAARTYPTVESFDDLKSRCRDVEGCWVWGPWLEAQTVRVNYKKTRLSARQLAWELVHGPTPPDHKIWQPTTCTHGYCVNPDHTRALTLSQAVMGCLIEGNMGRNE